MVSQPSYSQLVGLRSISIRREKYMNLDKHHGRKVNYEKVYGKSW